MRRCLRFIPKWCMNLLKNLQDKDEVKNDKAKVS